MAIATLMSIKELDGKIFWIPAYQRGFRWARKQMKDLLDDLNAFINGNSKKYCLQPIVIKSISDGNGDVIYEVIDGQQRLTALFLLAVFFKSSPFRTMHQKTYADYTLNFQGKSSFEGFLKAIYEYVNSPDPIYPEDFKNKLCELKKTYSDIDSKNAVNTLEYLLDRPDALHIIYSIYVKLSDQIADKDVCVIWHEMTSVTEDKDSNSAIEAFANINANKIPLTDAELIKAVLIQAYGNEQLAESNNNAVSNRESIFSSQWESVERSLNNREFWSFFVRHGKEYKTRIDILFEIWMKTAGVTVPSGDHKIYRAVCKYLGEGGSARELWNSIIAIFETLQDWYNDYRNYHLIGCISSLKLQVKDNAALVFELYERYHSCKDKDEFNKYLRDLIKTALISKIADRNCGFESVLANFKHLTYHDSYTKDLLMVFNIALLVNTYNTCNMNKVERFSFDYYKNNNIEVEHINPQHSNTLLVRDWERKIRPVLEDKDISSEKIDEMTKEDKENEAGIHELGNLTLVDKKLNIGFSDGDFTEKRSHIISAMYGTSVAATDKKYEYSVLFPGTRWVFLRQRPVDDPIMLQSPIWSSKDREAYVAQIEESLKTFLIGG